MEEYRAQARAEELAALETEDEAAERVRRQATDLAPMVKLTERDTSPPKV
jgi:hypothetical protein